MQIAAEQVLRSFPSFAGRSKLSTWTYRICYVTVLRHERWYRRWLRRFTLTDRGDVDTHTPTREEPTLEEFERAARLRKAVERLSPKRRTVVVLHDLEGHSVEDIAGIVAAKPLTVRSRLRDGRRDLARILSADPLWRRSLPPRGERTMNPQCSEPDLQAELLSDARDAATLTPDLALHLEGCASCQTAVERLKRMASVWTADQVDEDAIHAAATRFHARKRTGRAAPGWFDVVPFATAGVAAGYLLLAATGTIGVPWKSRLATDALPQTVARVSTVAAASSARENDSPRFAPVFAATDESAKSVRARRHIETPRGVAPLVDGLRVELKRGESARVALAGGHSSKVEGPCLVEFWSTPTEVGGWRIVRDESAAPPSAVIETPAAASVASPPLAAPSTPSAAVEGEATESAAPSNSANKKSGPGTRQVGAAAALNETVTSNTRDLADPGANLMSVRAWARAAAALREDDFDAADRAFDELGHAVDPATRDAARLARAQLWISRGREAAVRPVLEQLAQSGATALVRQRAAEFLYR